MLRLLILIVSSYKEMTDTLVTILYQPKDKGCEAYREVEEHQNLHAHFNSTYVCTELRMSYGHIMYVSV